MALTTTIRLSDELKQRHPEIHWEQVRGSAGSLGYSQPSRPRRDAN